MNDAEKRELHKQREEHRKEVKRQKEAKKKKIAWIVIAVAVVVLIALRISEIDFSSFNKSHTDSNGKFSLSSGYDSSIYPISLDSSENAVCSAVSGDVAVLTSGSFRVLNPSDAEVKNEVTHKYSNPVLETNGAYALVYDQGGKKFRLETNGKNIYEATSENNIICATVSNGGIVAVATLSDSSKCSIIVYSKSLEKTISYDVSLGYVAEMSVDSSGNYVAFSCFNSENAQLVTKVCILKVKDGTVSKEFDLIYPTLYDLRFSGTDLYCVSQEGVCVISDRKKLVDVFENSKGIINSYCYNDSGYLTVCRTDYENSDSISVCVVKPSGKTSCSFTVSQVPKQMKAANGNFYLYIGNEILCFNKNGEVLQKIDCGVISSFTVISKRIFYIKQSILECHSL